MRRHVRIYIEGGAEGREADSDFRRGWKQLLSELHKLARDNGFHSLEVVRGRSRRNAFERFKAHQREHPNDLCALLVDSETPVPESARVWDVVANRPGDRWERPSWATEDHLYLMVHTVETWLLTDQEALRRYYGPGFRGDMLPTTKLEERSKADVERALQTATRDSAKRSYRHAHAIQIIGTVRQDRVKTLRHGQRLFDSLGSLIRGKRSA